MPFDASNPWPWLSHLLLPGITLAFQFAAIYVRMIRASVLGRDGRGLRPHGPRQGRRRAPRLVNHALRNALLPIVTIFGLDLGILLGGAILTEYTFGIPGIGRLTGRGRRGPSTSR